MNKYKLNCQNYIRQINYMIQNGGFKVKKILALIMTAAVLASLAACSRYDENSSSAVGNSSESMSSSIQNMKDDIKNGSNKVMEMFTERKYPDGTYRGAFVNPSELDITFEVKNNKFVKFKFNALGYKGNDYSAAAENNVSSQYKELADYLVGKEVWDLKPLYTPDNIIKELDKNLVVSGKLISAINDGLNRGVFMPLGEDEKMPAKEDNSSDISSESSDEINSSSNSSENK